MVMPAMVMFLLLPMFLLANVAVADAVERVTVSPLSTPESAAVFLMRSVVADVLAS